VEKGLNYSLSATQASPIPEHQSQSYTESPKFLLSAPESVTTPRGHSPNRTCYLSPHAASLSFNQRNHQTDSESDHLVIANSESEAEKEKKKLEKTPTNKRTKKGVKLRLDDEDLATSADDNAVADEGETLEAVQAAVSGFNPASGNLSDTETFPALPEVNPTTSKAAKFLNPPSVSSINLALSESDSEPEDPSNKDTTESFLSALKQTCAKKKEAVKPLAATSTVKVTQAGKVGKRISLVSCVRKSPLKNDSTDWEARHDAHCLDKYTIHYPENVTRSTTKNPRSRPEETSKKRKLSDDNSATEKKVRRESGPESRAVTKQRQQSGAESRSTTKQHSGTEPRSTTKQQSETEPRSTTKSSATETADVDVVKVPATSVNQGELLLSFSPRKSTRLMSKANPQLVKETQPSTQPPPPQPAKVVDDEPESNDEEDSDESSSEDDSSEDELTDHENDERSDHEQEAEAEASGSKVVETEPQPSSSKVETESTSSGSKVAVAEPAPSGSKVGTKPTSSGTKVLENEDTKEMAPTRIDTSLIKMTYGTVVLTYQKLYEIS